MSAFAEREAQWKAFHHWESSIEGSDLTLEERVAWYGSALRFALKHTGQTDSADNLQDKARTLHRVRQRLSGLSTAPRNA